MVEEHTFQWDTDAALKKEYFWGLVAFDYYTVIATDYTDYAIVY